MDDLTLNQLMATLREAESSDPIPSDEDEDGAQAEVCVGCGSYFGWRGGDQLCWKCRRN